MASEGKISVENESGFVIWQPDVVLEALSSNDARYSRGFLTKAPLTFFSGLSELWLPLAQSLGCDVRLLSCEASFEAPSNISRLVSFEVKDERAFLAYREDSEFRLSNSAVPGIGESGSDVVLEYLERRLLSALSLSWRGTDELQCFYGRREEIAALDAVGFVHLRFSLDDAPFDLSVGLSRKVLDFLDHSARGDIVQEMRSQGEHVVSDQIHSVSVELAELAVPPAMLIDYIRADTIVDLESPSTIDVVIRVDDQLWAEGVLGRFEDSYAVTITSGSPTERSFPEGTTRVRVEVARTELDASGLATHLQSGAVLLCDTVVRPQASLIISGENVARAAIGTIGENFAIQVLPK